MRKEYVSDLEQRLKDVEYILQRHDDLLTGHLSSCAANKDVPDLRNDDHSSVSTVGHVQDGIHLDALNVKGKPFKGNSGLEAADYICQYHAKNGGLSGRYSAWLSDSTTDAIDRITTASVPYLMPDGTQVAASFEPFIDSGTLLDHPVCVDELLNAHGDEDYNVMTGTTEFGVYRSGLACSDWQDGPVSVIPWSEPPPTRWSIARCWARRLGGLIGESEPAMCQGGFTVSRTEPPKLRPAG